MTRKERKSKDQQKKMAIYTCISSRYAVRKMDEKGDGGHQGDIYK